MTKKEKKGKEKMNRKRKGTTWQDIQIVDYFNTRLFADIIDSFNYIFDCTPNYVTLKALGLIGFTQSVLWQNLYKDAVEDWGFDGVRSGATRLYRIYNDKEELMGTTRKLAKHFDVNESTIRVWVSLGEHKGYKVEIYNGDFKPLFEDLTKKGYDMTIFKNPSPALFGICDYKGATL